RVSPIIHEIVKSSPMRMPSASVSPSRRADSRWRTGNRPVRIAMKTTLSTPRTISRAASVASAIRPSAVRNASIVGGILPQRPSVPTDDPLPGAVWHRHEASCHYRDFRELPAASARACPARHPASGEPFVGWHPALAVAHVWAWYPNPDGVFAESNPWLGPYGGIAAPAHHARNPAETFYSQLTHRVAGTILLTLAA